MEGGDMSTLAPIAPRIAPLVRMLGSSVDGETLGACRAIRCTLNTAGYDYHDLALVVERAALPVVAEPPRQEPESTAKPWQDVARDRLRRGAGRLNEAEMDFLRSMATWPSEPSGKQERWLDAIAMSLGLEVAA
jgi:hypothetical protein